MYQCLLKGLVFETRSYKGLAHNVSAYLEDWTGSYGQRRPRGVCTVPSSDGRIHLVASGTVAEVAKANKRQRWMRYIVRHNLILDDPISSDHDHFVFKRRRWLLRVRRHLVSTKLMPFEQARRLINSHDGTGFCDRGLSPRFGMTQTAATDRGNDEIVR